MIRLIGSTHGISSFIDSVVPSKKVILYILYLPFINNHTFVSLICSSHELNIQLFIFS